MSTITPTTSLTRPTGVQGRIAFETDTKNIIVYDGANWRGYASDGVFTSYPTNTKALDFDGSNDYVRISYDSSLDITGAMSITAWVKFDSLSGFPMIYAKGKYIDALTGFQFYSTSNKIAFYDGSGSVSSSSTTLSTGVWYHVAMTRSASRAITFYLNGSPDGTDTRTGTPSTGSKTFNIGSDSSGNYLNGIIDEVAVFNSELTSNQISNIYSNKLYPEMVSFWRFEDDVTDSVGSNDGTNNGATFTTDNPY